MTKSIRVKCNAHQFSCSDMVSLRNCRSQDVPASTPCYTLPGRLDQFCTPHRHYIAQVGLWAAWRLALLARRRCCCESSASTLVHNCAKSTKESRPFLDRFARGFQRLVEKISTQLSQFSFFDKKIYFDAMLHFVTLGLKRKWFFFRNQKLNLYCSPFTIFLE